MTTPAGWYDDPENANTQRYWDGQNWTSNRHPKAAPGQPAAAPSPPPVAVSSAPPPPQPNQQPPWQPVGQQPQRSNNPTVIIGLIAAIVVLAGGAIFAYMHFGKSHPSSPEDQIKAVVQHEQDDYNKSNFTYNPEFDCKANSSVDTAHVKELRKLRAQAGTVSLSVSNIQVTGDHATADVTMKFQKISDTPPAQTLQFVKEDGRWKDCTPPDSSDNGDGQ